MFFTSLSLWYRVRLCGACNEERILMPFFRKIYFVVKQIQMTLIRDVICRRLLRNFSCMNRRNVKTHKKNNDNKSERDTMRWWEGIEKKLVISYYHKLGMSLSLSRLFFNNWIRFTSFHLKYQSHTNDETEKWTTTTMAIQSPTIFFPQLPFYGLRNQFKFFFSRKHIVSLTLDWTGLYFGIYLYALLIRVNGNTRRSYYILEIEREYEIAGRAKKKKRRKKN